jgi:hypothetical protein
MNPVRQFVGPRRQSVNEVTNPVRQFVSSFIERTELTTYTNTNHHREFVSPTSPEGNAAYLAGLCVDCRSSRHSAGRPRCNDCHTVWQQRHELSGVTNVPPAEPETWEQRLARYDLGAGTGVAS